MNVALLKDEFKSRVCEQIDLEPEGENRFLVINPFRFDDGDHFVITLKREGDRWILSDEASTIMHLSYWLDEEDATKPGGKRREIIDNSLATFSVENRDGELIIPVKEDRFGDALFNLIQGLTKVTDISFLSREIVRSTFMEDLKSFLQRTVDETRLEFDWKDERHDPIGNYAVDFRVNGMKRPFFIYGLPSEEKVSLATINLLTFEKWKVPFQSIGIYEEQEKIPPKPVARFTDVIEKAFSSLRGNEDRITEYLRKKLPRKALKRKA
jgi:Domain of unknown function DUF1828